MEQALRETAGIKETSAHVAQSKEDNFNFSNRPMWLNPKRTISISVATPPTAGIKEKSAHGPCGAIQGGRASSLHGSDPMESITFRLP